MFDRLKDSWFVWHERKHLMIWRSLMKYYLVLFVVWGTYRLLIELPVVLEETLLKGLVFGLPVWWMLWKQNRKAEDIGIRQEGLFHSIYMGLGLGAVLGILGQAGNLWKYGGVIQDQFSSEMLGGFLILALMTAVWEELVFSGYILHTLRGLIVREELLVGVVGLMYSFLHVPALLVGGVGGLEMMMSLLLLMSLSVGVSVLTLRTKNLMAAIMTHTVWGVTIALFA